MSLVCRPASPADALSLAVNLRPEDRNEVAAARPGVDVSLVIMEGLTSCVGSWAVVQDDDKPLALMGVLRSTAHPGLGLVWLLASEGIERHALYITKLCRYLLDRGRDSFPSGYTALAWEGNRTHRRWLPLVGFHPSPLEPLALPGGLFLWYNRNV
jgi:hypothetical protein